MTEWSIATILASMSRAAQPDVSHPWPQGFAHVDGAAVTDLYFGWHIASRVHWQRNPMWTTRDQVPHTVKLLFNGGDVSKFRPPYWRFAYPRERGQILMVPDPNVVIVFNPEYGGTELVWVELGCKHEFEAVRRSNCYQEDRCTNCGYHWAVDSSD
jgi:hypothetical protein